MNPLARRTNRWLEPFDLPDDLQDDFGQFFSPSLHLMRPTVDGISLHRLRSMRTQTNSP